MLHFFYGLLIATIGLIFCGLIADYVIPILLTGKTHKTNPLKWNHNPENVIGRVKVEDCEDGIYVRCYLNDSQSARRILNHLREE